MSGKRLSGEAMQAIPYGSRVLCRNNEVRRAKAEIANATADPDPFWSVRGRKGYRKGEWVFATPIEGLGDRCLKALASGPIMEPLRLYLPAGKLSEAEYQARLDLDFERVGIDRREGSL